MIRKLIGSLGSLVVGLYLMGPLFGASGSYDPSGQYLRYVNGVLQPGPISGSQLNLADAIWLVPVGSVLLVFAYFLLYAAVTGLDTGDGVGFKATWVGIAIALVAYLLLPQSITLLAQIPIVGSTMAWVISMATGADVLGFLSLVVLMVLCAYLCNRWGYNRARQPG